MAVSIVPRVERGRLYFQTADVLFPTFEQAATAWAAAEAHRLAVAEPIDELIVQRTAALAELCRADDDLRRVRSRPSAKPYSPPKFDSCVGKAVSHKRHDRNRRGARHVLSLRALEKTCTPEQRPLKFRLTRAADSLDAIVLMAVRGNARIEQLELELRQFKAVSGQGDAQ